MRSSDPFQTVWPFSTTSTSGGGSFERYYYRTFEVELPVVAIARKNVFKIRNVTKEEALEKRRKLVLNYVVLKR